MEPQQDNFLLETQINYIKQIIKDKLLYLPENSDQYLYYGPLLMRLVWHSSGTYNINSKTGGCPGATMRFQKELNDPENKGLQKAINFCDDIMKILEQQNIKISLSDLWVLASYSAIQDMGGPTIEFKQGRIIHQNDSKCPENGRLPKSNIDACQIREIFQKMGQFDDSEIVALIGGGHCCGKMYKQNSGFQGCWTDDTNDFTNKFFEKLLTGKYCLGQQNGKDVYQSENYSQNKLLMLPADMALKQDIQFKKWCDIYLKDEQLFFSNFSKAFKKLSELGM